MGSNPTLSASFYRPIPPDDLRTFHFGLTSYCVALFQVDSVQKKIFWLVFAILSLIADLVLPLLWGLVATIPILLISWWLVYRTGLFE